MMDTTWIIIVIQSIVICAIVVALFLAYRKIIELKKERKNAQLLRESGKIIPSLSIHEVLKLVNNDFLVDIDILVESLDISKKSPMFYEKYQELSKNNRDAFFQNLLDVICKDNPVVETRIIRYYDLISEQDILLLLLSEQSVENKMLAKILCLNLETLKKRKTRLKAKLREAGMELTF